jgi:hypothetical protein
MKKFSVEALPSDGVLQDFAYVVIEYFKDGMDSRPSDIALRIMPQDDISLKLQQAYDKTNDHLSSGPIVLPAGDNRVFTGHWDHIQLIVVIEPSAMQTYFSESLDHSHYSVHPLEYKSYLSYLKLYQRKNNGRPSLKFCCSQSNHWIAGKLWVTNTFDKVALEVLGRSPLSDVSALVDEHGVVDEKRGNQKLDTGLASPTTCN